LQVIPLFVYRKHVFRNSALKNPDYEIVVAGAGLAGLAATLALANLGYRVANIAPQVKHVDQRTTALWDGSLAFFDKYGIGQSIHEAAAPIRTIRIIDATGRLLHAGQTEFHASEIGLERFGVNISNIRLSDLIRKKAQDSGNVDFIPGTIIRHESSNDYIEIETDNKTIYAGLLVGADGRGSSVRQRANITTRDFQYPQTALVLNFDHSLPHEDVSTEFHRSSGPFTMVPLGMNSSSLVWVLRSEEAGNIVSMEQHALELEIERCMHSILGKITIKSAVQSFPLSWMLSKRLGKGRIVLVGEAAHQIPPIGAQGLNLGIRDVNTLQAIIAGKTSLDAATGDEYHSRRQFDVNSRANAIDLLNRSLLSDALPIQLLRSAGLTAINNIGPLRRLVIREGLAPGWRQT
jgi:2-octaprenyl-6-methoxyphenol hydroxylase